jgi:glycine/D-amino acid oxidase-like deaminating enzyme
MMEKLRQLILEDPGLPRSKSTRPYWLNNEHSLARQQSTTFPNSADIVIIGSGITGLRVASTLLEELPDVSIVVLEARTLCSGATGRNGGHLITPGPLMYSKLKKDFGKESALKIVRVMQETVDEVAALAIEVAPEESEIRRIQRLRTYVDQDLFEVEQKSVAEYETDYPKAAGRVKFISGDSCLQVGLCSFEEFDVSDIVPETWLT